MTRDDGRAERARRLISQLAAQGGVSGFHARADIAWQSTHHGSQGSPSWDFAAQDDFLEGVDWAVRHGADLTDTEWTEVRARAHDLGIRCDRRTFTILLRLLAETRLSPETNGDEDEEEDDEDGYGEYDRD